MDKPLIVSLNSKLYDVSAFASKHPGGAKVLKAVAGQDLTMYMNGSQRIIQLKHEHSKSAYDILERYAIDQRIEVYFWVYPRGIDCFSKTAFSIQRTQFCGGWEICMSHIGGGSISHLTARSGMTQPDHFSPCF